MMALSDVAANAAWNYNAAYPDRPGLVAHNGMLAGCWMIGACYKNPNGLYGAYPHGYLERVHSMFPSARRILHAFSGGLTYRKAQEVAAGQVSLTRQECRYFSQYKGVRRPTCGCRACWGLFQQIHLVDCKGHEDGRWPTWLGDVTEMPEGWEGKFDLILADPPYSAEDSKKYGVKHPNILKVLKELRRVAEPGAVLVWLDQKWPQHSKKLWRTFGTIGLVRSTNHRMRLVSMFEAV